MKKNGLYSLVVILLTAISVYAMRYYKNPFVNQDPGYMVQYEDNEDKQYEGYIFDDYNKAVNLSYVDNVYKNTGNSESVISIRKPEYERTADECRMLRSERIIDERAIKDETLKNCSPDTFANGQIYQIGSAMEGNDRDVFMEVMRKLEQNDMLQFKKLFDRGISSDEMKNIMELLKNKITSDEYTWLSKAVNKYGMK